MHNFHSMEYVTKWTDSVNNPVRESVFYHIIAHLTRLPFDTLHVVELACGPGMLAEVVLSRLPKITYEGLDYSKPMLKMAKERLAPFGDRVALRRVDLRTADWASAVVSKPNAIISMQALHDVGGEEEHSEIYRAAKDLLTPGGLLLNADFVRREMGESGPSRMTIPKHIELLNAQRFAHVKYTLDFSRYGCIVGYTPGD